MGSPPHMRGKVYELTDEGLVLGITPAHAGKSNAVRSAEELGRDHPRTCGEKKCGKFTAISGLGSPPHMRGKESAVEFNGGDVGITPAHAGKSHPADCRCCVPGDHPRTCGEKVMNLMYSEVSMGSPPHMRGKVEYSSR